VGALLVEDEALEEFRRAGGTADACLEMDGVLIDRIAVSDV